MLSSEIREVNPHRYLRHHLDIYVSYYVMMHININGCESLTYKFVSRLSFSQLCQTNLWPRDLWTPEMCKKGSSTPLPHTERICHRTLRPWLYLTMIRRYLKCSDLWGFWSMDSIFSVTWTSFSTSVIQPHSEDIWPNRCTILSCFQSRRNVISTPRYSQVIAIYITISFLFFSGSGCCHIHSTRNFEKLYHWGIRAKLPFHMMHHWGLFLYR